MILKPARWRCDEERHRNRASGTGRARSSGPRVAQLASPPPALFLSHVKRNPRRSGRGQASCLLLHPSIRCPLLIDIFPDDFKRGAAAGYDAIARRPKMLAPQVAGDLREFLFSDQSRRRFLQAVDQRRRRDLRRIAHQQMQVIVLAVKRLQRCREIGAYLRRDRMEELSRTRSVSTPRRYLVEKTKWACRRRPGDRRI